MPFEKKYIVATVRAESKEIVSLELVDATSKPPLIKTAVLRIGTEEYEGLGKPTVNQTMKLTVEVES